MGRGGHATFPGEGQRSKGGSFRERERDSKGFGLAPDPFKSAIKRYGLWPITVWDLDSTDRVMQKLKIEVGDGAILRKGVSGLPSGYGKGKKGKNWSHANKDINYKEGQKENNTASVFNPIVAINIFNLYAPKQGICYDPFAGGGTRAIVAAKFGLDYVGVELRQEEVNAVYDRCKYNEVEVEIICASSANVPQIKSSSADFLLTCPPYWNLEQYKGGEEDMSMAGTYEEFLSILEKSIKESYRILKSGSLSCWIVGLFRDKDGELLALNHDIAWLHRGAGFKFKEEIVLNMKNTGAMQRVGSFDKGQGFLIRVHEYCLVFLKE